MEQIAQHFKGKNKKTNPKEERIKLEGKVFDEFNKVDRISEIILLGEKGKIRRIIFK
jgi:hypothetical protein